MIMGEPPDIEIKSKKWFFILFMIFIFLSFVGIILFLAIPKKSDSLVASKTSSPVVGIQPIKDKSIDNEKKVEFDTTSEKPDPFDPKDSTQIDTKGLLSTPEANSQGVSANKTIAAQTPTAVSLKGETEQKIGKIETKSSVEQVKEISVHNKKFVLPALKTSTFSAMLNFEYKSANLSPEALDRIKDIFHQIKGKKGRLILEGHTCSVGSDMSNVDLSEMRVKNVVKAFRELGLGVNIRMFKFYYGENTPIDTNETVEGRARNRRVAIRFIPNH